MSLPSLGSTGGTSVDATASDKASSGHKNKAASTKPKFQPNPLSKKYGHHAGNLPKKSSTSLNQLKQQLRSVTRMISKFPERRDLLDSKRGLEQRIQMAKTSAKEMEMREKYKYLKFVGKV